MFLHNFKYTFKTLMRDRMLIFWTFAFPIILGVFFQMAFSNVENSEKFDVIDIAVVDNEAFNGNQVLKEALAMLGDKKSEEQMFDIRYVSEKEARQLLKSDEVVGFLLMEDETQKVVVKASGVSETIFKSVVEEIVQTSDMVGTMARQQIEAHPQNFLKADGSMDEAKIEELCMELVESVQGQEVPIKNISKENLSYTMIEFYTLIAMTCLYGGIIGMTAINQNLANMSSNGRRVAVSPTGKGKVVLSCMCAGYVIQLIGIAILFLFTIFILKVDYGDNLPLMAALALVGCLAGLTMGIAIGTLLKTNENAKIGVVIAVTMFGCFLSGMMGITMKYIIDKNMPVINKINPAAMITDGFYSLYYYDTLDRYVLNVASLLIFSGVMLVLSWRSLRRVRYDSI